MLKKLLVTISLFVAIFSFNSFAMLDISLVSDTYENAYPTLETSLEIYTGALSEDSDSEFYEFSPDTDNARVVTILAVSKKESSWYKDDKENKYFIVEMSESSRKTYSQGALSNKKAYQAAMLVNCTALIGDDKNGYKIYQFDSNGRMSYDGSAAVIYNSNGDRDSSVENSQIPVYSNPTGWKSNGTGSWYYYTDGSHVLYDGYAAIINTTDTTYNIYKFNKSATTTSTGKIKTSGSADEVIKKAPTSYSDIPAKSVSITGEEVKKLKLSTNSGYSASGKVTQTGIKENEGINTGENSSYMQVLEETSYDGCYYSNYNQQGWKQVNSTWRYYTSEFNYLVDGYAVIGEDENNTIYQLYKFNSNGSYSETGIRGPLETMRNKSSTQSYSVATTKRDSALESIEENGQTAYSLSIYAVYDDWEKVGSNWRYKWGGEGTYLRNGYAIISATKRTYALYHFNSNGILDESGKEYDTAEEVKEHADTSIAYKEAEEYEEGYDYSDDDDNGDTCTAAELPSYEAESGWEQLGSNWRYFTSNYSVLYGGCAIVKWGGQYCVYKFKSNGYYDSQVGSGASSKQALISSHGNSKFIPADEMDIDEDEEYDEDDEYYDDYDSDDEDGYEIMDDGLTYKDGVVISWNGKKFYSDAEFLAEVTLGSGTCISPGPGGAALAIIPGHADEETPSNNIVKEQEEIENTLGEVAIKDLPQLTNWDCWDGDTYVKDGKKAILGFAIVRWAKNNQYCLAEFDANGKVTQQSNIKLSIQKVIEDEEIADDSYQPIVWGNK